MDEPGQAQSFESSPRRAPARSVGAMASTGAARRGFPSPFDVPIPAGCEGWEEMYAYHALVQRGSPRRSTRAASGSRTRCTRPSRSTRSTRRARLRRRRLQPGEHPPVRRAAVARSRVPHAQRLLYVSANSVTDEATLARARGAVPQARRLLLRALGRALRALAEEGRGGDPRARAARRARAPRVRGRGRRHRGPRRRLEPRPARRLRPPARGTRPHLPVPLRVPEPRLRRLPRLLRALPAGVPRHHGPDDRQDGLGHRRPRPAPGRRAEAPRPARARARSGASRRRRRQTRRALRASSRRQRAGSALAGRLRGDEEPVVLLLERERPLPPPSLLDRRHDGCRSRRSARTSAPRGGRGHLAPDGRRARRARTDHRRVPRRCCRTRMRQAVRRAASRSLAPSSRTSRTTTSTSSTGTSRSSGTRCASSAHCSPRHGSSPTRRTSSTSVTTRCARRSRSSGSCWSSGGAGVARGPRYWPPIVARRKAIYEAMCEWAPPPALGQVPETITDPVTVMLCGITDERIAGVALGRRTRPTRAR